MAPNKKKKKKQPHGTIPYFFNSTKSCGKASIASEEGAGGVDGAGDVPMVPVEASSSSSSSSSEGPGEKKPATPAKAKAFDAAASPRISPRLTNKPRPNYDEDSAPAEAPTMGRGARRKEARRGAGDFVSSGAASDDDMYESQEDEDDDGYLGEKSKTKGPSPKKPPRPPSAKKRAADFDADDEEEDVPFVEEPCGWKHPILPIPPPFRAEEEEKGKTKGGRNAFNVLMSSKQPAARKKSSSSSLAGRDDDEAKFSADLDNDHPVLSRPADIFADMVERFPEIGDLAKRMDRPLRVATMCSGTEAPLLALDLTSQAAEALHGAPLPVEHIFSSEVEPFKQAYIQRNFAPPLLFRDVRELGNKQAHTAFGALEDVPQERDSVDVLVAGTSCVDYSNLNDHKKKLDEMGESGQTFYGMFEWVQRARPAIVLLENVCGAPWAGMKKNFAQIKYHAHHVRLDTKNFYLPQTRTRGYMLAVAQERCDASVLDAWEAKLMKFRRAASASLEAFMLDADDPRVSAARADLNHATRNKNEVPWGRCEARHARVRVDEKLGSKRPVTNWSHGTNTAALPDFAWRDWASAQTERVLDSIDIDYMRLIRDRQDANFKTSVWDLSQNVDRSNPTNAKLGICPCLTPSLCAYVTNQGRPVIGVETLALQGIPIDDLLLTRESEDNLTSLSGNAMSTTVVGSAILAALLVLPEASKRKLGLVGEPSMLPSPAATTATTSPSKKEKNEKGKPPPSSSSSSSLKAAKPAIVVDDTMAPEAAPLRMGRLAPSEEPEACDIFGPQPESACLSVEALRHGAAATACRCVCESRTFNSAARVQRCVDCGHTACAACAGKPVHRYEADARPRRAPRAFETALATALPAQLKLAGLDAALLEKHRPAATATAVELELWSAWVGEMRRLEGGAHFRLTAVKRADRWRAAFVDATGDLTLELVVNEGSDDGAAPEWFVSIKPPSKRGQLRDVLMRPVLRGVPRAGLAGEDVVQGLEWAVRLPSDKVCDATVAAGGELIESYEATFAMEDGSSGSRRFSELHVTCATAPELSGVYDALPRCAAALGSLHKRRRKKQADDQQSSSPRAPDVYCFLESQPVARPDQDCYVFASDWRKLHLGEARASTLATFEPAWRPKVVQAADATESPSPSNNKRAKKKDAATTATLNVARWTTLGPAVAIEDASLDGTVRSVAAATAVDLRTASPFHMITALEASAPLADLVGHSSVWRSPQGSWAALSAAKLGGASNVNARISKELGFLAPRLTLPGALRAWQPVASVGVLADRLAALGTCCAVCAPRPPDLEWAKSGTAYVAVEDPYSAGVYERALKDRPSTFALHARLRESSPSEARGGAVGDLRIAVNATVLATRAFASLPSAVHRRADEAGTVLEWRVIPGEATHERAGANAPRPFALSSNRGDAEAAQPKSFVKSGAALRPEQLRSLTWMLRQERGVPFVEEEVVDETLAALGWRAEARVKVPTTVHGGVLADAVGYGKTAITLALIDETRSEEPPALPAYHRHGGGDGAPKAVACKATLIVVPNHLLAQWPAELDKFVGEANLKVRVVTNITALKALTVADVLAADVIFVGVAVFRADSYYEHLADFASVHALPKKGGRYFEEVHARAVANVERYVPLLLSDGGVPALREAQAEDRKRLAVRIEVNTSKKQAYKDAAPTRGQREKSTTTKPPAAKKQKKKVMPSKNTNKNKAPAAEEAALIDEPRRSPRKTKPLPPAEDEDSDEDDMMGDESDDESVEVPKTKARTSTKTAKKGAATQPWEKVKGPPLQMFYFARKVVDEYTYLEQRDVSTIQGIKARSSWVLSGTPPIDTFDDVKGIAAFLGVHLGAPDPVQLTKKGAIARKELSKSELFHEFLEARSASWHARRRDLAQSFVAGFIRQNIAEIDEIPFEEMRRPVDLPSAERAVYLELEHHLRALEMQSNRGRVKATNARTKPSDRECRLREALEGSADAHEALLKRCAFSSGKAASVVGACDDVVKKRTLELEDCAVQIARDFAAAHRLQNELRRWDALRPISGPAASKKRGPAQDNDIFDKYVGSGGMWLVASGTRNSNPAAAVTTTTTTTKTKKRKDASSATCASHRHMRELDEEIAKGFGDAEAGERLQRLWASAMNKAMKNPVTASPSKKKRATVPEEEEDDDDDDDDDDDHGNNNNNNNNKKKKKTTTKRRSAARKSTASAASMACGEEKDEKLPPFRVRAKAIGDAAHARRVDNLIFPEPVVPGETDAKQKEREATLKELMWALRTTVYELRALSKEFVGRCRSLRFFQGIERTAKASSSEASSSLVCDATQRKLKLEDYALLSCCGHAGDVGALKAAAAHEICPVPGCKAAVRLHSVVPCAPFAKADAATSTLATAHGAKLAAIVDLIHSFPADERVLVFVQFADLLASVEQVLAANDIPSLRIKGTAQQVIKTMTAFQDPTPGHARVLLLELHNESASGANLTTANHAIFVHPLHVEKLQTYIACETQAIGRVRRYGQKKTVHLYRFLATETVDTELDDQRTAEIKARDESIRESTNATIDTFDQS